jgi:hypothetical protein
MSLLTFLLFNPLFNIYLNNCYLKHTHTHIKGLHSPPLKTFCPQNFKFLPRLKNISRYFLLISNSLSQVSSSTWKIFYNTFTTRIFLFLNSVSLQSSIPIGLTYYLYFMFFYSLFLLLRFFFYSEEDDDDDDDDNEVFEACFFMVL